MAGEQSHGYELPEQTAPEQGGVEQGQDLVEVTPAPVETDRQRQEQAKQPPQLTVPDDDDQTVVAVDDQAAAAAAPSEPTSVNDQAIAKLPAKDGDLIEKEWVEKAKTIINKTADDPHRQKHEVSKMKAAYIQKRFNKVIKADEAPA